MNGDKKDAVIGLLTEGAAEIERLRRENQVLGEKLALVEGLLSLPHLRGPSQGMAPDVAWALRKVAFELKEGLTEATPVPAAAS